MRDTGRVTDLRGAAAQPDDEQPGDAHPDDDSLLAELDAAAPIGLMAVLERRLHHEMQARSVSLLLVEYGLQLLERLDASRPGRSVEELPIEGTRAGSAFAAQCAEVGPESAGGFRVFMPVTVREERFGVLEVDLPIEPTEASLAHLRHTAVVLGYVLVSATRYTDLYERVRRKQPFALAAEMQWSLLPVTAFSAPGFAVAGQLIPAYEVGGDNFDYAVEADQVTVTCTDAMGHQLRAAVLGSLAVSAMRNARRGGGGLVEQTASADRAVYGQFGGEQFVTALLLDIDLATGDVTAVNAGAPGPLRQRAAGIEELSLEPQLPLGLFEQSHYVSQPGLLEPGDRLLLSSDGLLEARRLGSTEEYAEARFAEVLASTYGDSPQEAVRAVIEDLQAWGGDLRDDATLLCFDYLGR
ncbi:MAG: PP2C family protein-serine/threonine phosphatase [Mycobacteriales bacterium]